MDRPSVRAGRARREDQVLGFSRQDRDTILRTGWVAAEITEHGGVAVWLRSRPTPLPVRRFALHALQGLGVLVMA
jgi:hypothetical protein